MHVSSWQVEGLSGLMRGPDKFYVAGYERFKGPGDTPRDSSPEKKQPKYEAPAPNYAEERRDRPHKTSKVFVFLASRTWWEETSSVRRAFFLWSSGEGSRGWQFLGVVFFSGRKKAVDRQIFMHKAAFLNRNN